MFIPSCMIIRWIKVVLSKRICVNHIVSTSEYHNIYSLIQKVIKTAMEKDIMFKMFFKCTINGEQNLILFAGL